MDAHTNMRTELILEGREWESERDKQKRNDHSHNHIESGLVHRIKMCECVCASKYHHTKYINLQNYSFCCSKSRHIIDNDLIQFHLIRNHFISILSEQIWLKWRQRMSHVMRFVFLCLLYLALMANGMILHKCACKKKKQNKNKNHKQPRSD